MVGDVVIAHEQFQVVDVVSPLQLAIDIPGVLAGKHSGVAMAFLTATFPDSQPVARSRFDRD